MSITAMKEAVEALKPFTEDADGIHEGWANERQRSSLSQKKPITVGDVRRAKLATEKLNTAIAEAEKPSAYIGKHVADRLAVGKACTTTMTAHMAFEDDVPLYLAQQPAPKQEPMGLTDIEIIALNHGDKYFFTSESRYGTDSNPYLQYHTGEPGFLGFSRAVIKAYLAKTMGECMSMFDNLDDCPKCGRSMITCGCSAPRTKYATKVGPIEQQSTVAAAPVQAQPAKLIEMEVGQLDTAITFVCGDGRRFKVQGDRVTEIQEDVPATTFGNMAPQFPIALRKMWTGQEVQDWINGHWPPISNPTEGYALISIDVLKSWGKYDLVNAACLCLLREQP